MDTAQITQQRAQKDEFFKLHPQSPLTSEQQAQFNGLSYFLPNPDLVFTVEVTLFPKAENVQVQTTTGQTQWYLRYGEFTVNINDESVRLTIYKMPPNHFFLPFVDTLSGADTYPAGRYMEPVQLADGRFLIDFNQAYNPYCAYGDKWSCPITPAENRVTVAIQAGEKLPQGDWVPKQDY